VENIFETTNSLASTVPTAGLNHSIGTFSRPTGNPSTNNRASLGTSQGPTRYLPSLIPPSRSLRPFSVPDILTDPGQPMIDATGFNLHPVVFGIGALKLGDPAR
jgi:hypothetical protein